MDVKQYMTRLGQQARSASRLIAKADTGKKNAALEAMAAKLEYYRFAGLANAPKTSHTPRKKIIRHYSHHKTPKQMAKPTRSQSKICAVANG